MAHSKVHGICDNCAGHKTRAGRFCGTCRRFMRSIYPLFRVVDELVVKRRLARWVAAMERNGYQKNKSGFWRKQ